MGFRVKFKVKCQGIHTNINDSFLMNIKEVFFQKERKDYKGYIKGIEIQDISCKENTKMCLFNSSQNEQTNFIEFEKKVDENQLKKMSINISSPIIALSPIQIKQCIEFLKPIMNTIIQFIQLIWMSIKRSFNFISSLIDGESKENINTIKSYNDYQCFIKHWSIYIKDKEWLDVFQLKGYTSMTYSNDWGNEQLRIILMNYQIISSSHTITKVPDILCPTTTIIILQRSKIKDIYWNLEICNDNIDINISSSDICNLKQLYMQYHHFGNENTNNEYYPIELYSIQREFHLNISQNVKKVLRSLQIHGNIDISIYKDDNESNKWWSYPICKLSFEEMFIRRVMNEDTSFKWDGDGYIQVTSFVYDLDEWFFVLEPTNFTIKSTQRNIPQIFCKEVALNVFPSFMKDINDFCYSLQKKPANDSISFSDFKMIQFKNTTPFKIVVKTSTKEYTINELTEMLISFHDLFIIHINGFEPIQIHLKTSQYNLLRNGKFSGKLIVLYKNNCLTLTSGILLINHINEQFSLTFKSFHNPKPYNITLSPFKEYSFHPIITTIPIHLMLSNGSSIPMPDVNEQHNDGILKSEVVSLSNHSISLIFNTSSIDTISFYEIHLYNRFQIISSLPYKTNYHFKSNSKSNQLIVEPFHSETITDIPTEISLRLEKALSGYYLPSQERYCFKLPSNDRPFQINEFIRGKLTTNVGITTLEIWIPVYVINNSIIPIMWNELKIMNDFKAYPSSTSVVTESTTFVIEDKSDCYAFNVSVGLNYNIIASCKTQQYIITSSQHCYQPKPSEHMIFVSLQHKFVFHNETNYSFNFKTHQQEGVIYPKSMIPLLTKQILLERNGIKRLLNLDQSMSSDLFFDGIYHVSIKRTNDVFVCTLSGCSSPTLRIENELNIDLDVKQKMCKYIFHIPSMKGCPIAWEDLNKEKTFIINGTEVSPFKINTTKIKINDNNCIVSFKLEKGVVMKIQYQEEVEENSFKTMELKVLTVGISVFDKFAKEILFGSIFGFKCIGGINEEIALEVCCDYFQIDSMWEDNVGPISIVSMNYDKSEWIEEETQRMVHFGISFVPSFQTSLTYIKFLTFNIQPLKIQTDTLLLSKLIQLKDDFRLSKRYKVSNPMQLIVDYLKINPISLSIQIQNKGVNKNSPSFIQYLSNLGGISLTLILPSFDLNEIESTPSLLISSYKNVLMDQFGTSTLISLFLGLYKIKPIESLSAFIYRLPHSSSLFDYKVIPYDIILTKEKFELLLTGNFGIRVYLIPSFQNTSINLKGLNERRKPRRTRMPSLPFDFHFEFGRSLTNKVGIFGVIDFVGRFDSNGQYAIILWKKQNEWYLSYLKRNCCENDVSLIWNCLGTLITSFTSTSNGIEVNADTTKCIQNFPSSQIQKIKDLLFNSKELIGDISHSISFN
ncbi:hypothetical protein ENU1_019310 [Entamoeba nuttalli P19]|uniref:Uncharacterized protein n=2 Tax=Entamoeba nuttalli TaxID=412467 RepID=K2HHP6_ENTNP|nr:hypothetical protein ENU1_019310 [Entamoeba nuttalli P19]EKE42494.1 hypothetical protein ENU1_019310 [Entamoeba nuttalli P19]|eukprot:XP_008855169.1 hypothetical protein ENU1_019310 [Entamoeba nuttalli P19]